MKTSIHIKPVSGHSEQHNNRKIIPDYVERSKMPLNESKVFKGIDNTFLEIKAKYEQNVGQKMQAKATPIREGVVVIKVDTTMADMERLAQAYEREFGIKTIQIHIHRDEGHTTEQGEWKCNNHAHMVFDWTNEQGKSVKMGKKEMSQMQTITAEVLGMERGEDKMNTGREHLEHKVFRELAEEVKKEMAKSIKSAMKYVYSSILTNDFLVKYSGFLELNNGNIGLSLKQIEEAIKKDEQKAADMLTMVAISDKEKEKAQKELANAKYASDKIKSIRLEMEERVDKGMGR
jgi:hypothetical protein